MSINSFSARVLLLACITSLVACSPRTGVRAGAGSLAPATGAANSKKQATGEDSATYPYILRLGEAVNRVEREPDAARVRIDFVRWSLSGYGGPEALFRVMNPADRPALVWNVRQQVAVPVSNGPGNSWETLESDYPGRGWETATIPAGGSVQFPMSSPTERGWRVCLLYSREAPDSQIPNRRFNGTYEAVGPTVHDVEAPQ